MNIRIALVCLLLAPSASAQTSDDLLRQMKVLGEQAAKLLPPDVPPVVSVLTTEALQAAINAAKPGTVIALEPGTVYRSILIPKGVTGLTLTSKGFSVDRTVLPTDAPLMATIQGSDRESYGILILGSQITVRGLHLIYNPPAGQGEMIRVGDAAATNLADVPDGVTLAQNLMQGNPGNDYGQKRAMAANGSHVLIDQNYVEDVWVPGQDSQCVAIFSTPGPVTIRRNVMACASENILIGGVPPAGPAFLPSDVLTEDNVLYKPLKWKGALPARVVKNLYEVKLGHRIMARHNWMENHWVQAQPGPAIVLTMATNGACGYCDMQDVGFESNVVTNVSAGISVTGYQYSYAPGAGQAVRFTVRNNFFVISKATMGGNGRPLIVSNEPKDVLVDHNTFLHDGSAVVASDYGTKWPLQDPPLTASIKGGPLTGFVFTNNAAQHGAYGIFTPEGTVGINVGTYFPSAVIGGNVWGGAPATALARYDIFAGSAGANGGPAIGAFAESYNADMCQSGGSPTGKGADCAALPWALKALVPR